MSIREIKLLSNTERHSLYTQPEFNEVEQALYFDFDSDEFNAANQYRTIKARVSFLLMLGHFKAKQQFYHPDFTKADDLAYLIDKYFSAFDGALNGKVDARLYWLQRAEILRRYDYSECNGKTKENAQAQLIKLLRYYPKPHNALRQLLVYFESQQVIVPSYRKLQDLFTVDFGLDRPA